MSQAQDVRELTYQSLLAIVIFQLSEGIPASRCCWGSGLSPLAVHQPVTVCQRDDSDRVSVFLICIVCEPRPVVRVRVRGGVVRIRVGETAVRIRIVVRTTNHAADETFHPIPKREAGGPPFGNPLRLPLSVFPHYSASSSMIICFP